MKTHLEKLPRLLDLIEEGDLALPDFQREFDWTAAETAELLVTVLNGWPAGSLLLLDRGDDIFPIKQFEGGPEVEHHKQLVLDGQQRLTSIFLGCREGGDAHFIVDLEVLRNDSSSDDAVRTLTTAEEPLISVSAAEQYRSGICPFHVLTDSADFYEWRDEVIEGLPGEDREKARDDLVHMYRASLRNVERYEFPVVVLESELEPEGIARIFERVNRTGQRLTTWDLMVARLYLPEWNLRKQWEIVQAEEENLAKFFSGDGLPLLRAISLRYDEDLRQSVVLGLRRELVHDVWDEFVRGTIDAVEFLGALGIRTESDLPYRVILPVLAALAVEYNLEAHEDALQRWFWSSAFTGEFDVAANTRGSANYLLLKNLAVGDNADIGWAVSATRLRNTTRRSSRAVWLGFIAWLRCQDEAKEAYDGGAGGGVVFSALESARTEPRPDGTGPYHLRVLANCIGPGEFVGRARKSSLAEALMEKGDDWSRTWLAANGLPESIAEMTTLVDHPEMFLNYRLDWLLAGLSLYGARVERV